MPKEENLSRREREKLRQRKEMLDAALALFSEKGFHNVSMHEIAEKAEFAVGTLYKFFENKEDLYQAIIQEQSNQFHESLTRAIEESDDEIEKLRNYVRTKAQIFMDNVAIVRLYFAETHGASFNIRAGLSQEIQKRYDSFLEKIAAIFERGIKKKRFRPIADPYHLAVALDSICNAHLFLWCQSPEKHPYPEDPDLILNILFNGLIEQS